MCLKQNVGGKQGCMLSVRREGSAICETHGVVLSGVGRPPLEPSLNFVWVIWPIFVDDIGSWVLMDLPLGLLGHMARFLGMVLVLGHL